MIGTESDKPILCPSSEEFAQALKDIDPKINVADFIEMARLKASLQMKSHGLELSSDATDIQRRAWENNRDTLVGIEFNCSLRELLVDYHVYRKSGRVYCASDHSPEVKEKTRRFSDKEKEFAEAAGFEKIEEIPEIDRPLANGMTILGQEIMIGDNVEAVSRLINEEGASPVALCGSMTPLELALQLGRAEIAQYLAEIIGN